MKTACLSFLFLCLAWGALNSRSLSAQEAGSGFDLRATLTGQAAASSELTDAPRSGSAGVAGFRSVVYPTWKIDNNLFVTGALQFATRPYFFEDFSTPGYGAKGSILQATLNYARVSNKGSVLLRAGELPTAFGSFLLRYDDADNPLVDMPMEYGYYYAPVSMLGLAGGQIDATRGKWDARAQFVNSSPVNPRSLFAKDQYGNWAGGAGYTIRQGFRVGASTFWGPYLDRKYRYFFPGEANPSTLPARALGLDAGWAHGHTSVLAEVQAFVFPYKAIPTFREWAGYGEVKQVLNPRWFVAVREGVTSSNEGGKSQCIESSVGFRPDRLQLIKIEYEYEHYATGVSHNENTLAVQFVTTLHFSEARN